MAQKEIRVYGATTKKELNPDLWESNKRLKEPIRKALLLIADKFIAQLEVKSKPKSIRFVGSSASYNWSADSDVDLHVVYDFSEFDTDEDTLRNYFMAKKTIFNSKHSITIYGLEVEVHIEDINDRNKSDGIYDLQNNVWISQPKYVKPDVNKARVKQIVKRFMLRIDMLEDIKDPTTKYTNALEIRDSIKALRMQGLRGGNNYSVENVAFKTLRNMKYLEKLYDHMVEGFDNSLSLKEHLEEQLSEAIRASQNKLIKEFGFEITEQVSVGNYDVILVKMDIMHKDMFGFDYQLTIQPDTFKFTHVKDQFELSSPKEIDAETLSSIISLVKQWNLKYQDIGMCGSDRHIVSQYKNTLHKQGVNTVQKNIKDLSILYLQ